MKKNLDEPLYPWKVGIYAAWYAFSAVWITFCYLGYRLGDHAVPSSIMSLARALSVTELIVVMVSVPLGVFLAGYLALRIVGRHQDEIASHA